MAAPGLRPIPRTRARESGTAAARHRPPREQATRDAGHKTAAVAVPCTNSSQTTPDPPDPPHPHAHCDGPGSSAALCGGARAVRAGERLLLLLLELILLLLLLLQELIVRFALPARLGRCLPELGALGEELVGWKHHLEMPAATVSADLRVVLELVYDQDCHGASVRRGGHA